MQCSAVQVEQDTLDSRIANLLPEEAEGSVVRRVTRVSLTIRHVPRASKMKLRLGR